MARPRGSVSGNNSVVECDLAKVEVAGSNPVSRSNIETSGPVGPPARSATSPLRRRLRSAPWWLEVAACGRSWALRYVAASSATLLRALVVGSRGLWARLRASLCGRFVARSVPRATVLRRALWGHPSRYAMSPLRWRSWAPEPWRRRLRSVRSRECLGLISCYRRCAGRRPR